MYTPRMMTMSFVRTLMPVVVGAAGLLISSGCTSYAAPALSVADASVAERTPGGTTLRFLIDAENSNSEALPLRSVRYTLSLNGQEVFRGYRSPEATIRRFGTQQISLPAVIASGAAGDDGQPLPGGVANYRLEGTLEYLTPGSIALILYDAEISRPTISFSKEGEIDLAR
jgi:Late embryogenesis abundant protein